MQTHVDLGIKSRREDEAHTRCRPCMDYGSASKGPSSQHPHSTEADIFSYTVQNAALVPALNGSLYCTTEKFKTL